MRFIYPKDTWRLLYPVRVLLAGLLVSELLATVVVWYSNHALHRKLMAIQAAGYSPLPGTGIDPSLQSLEAAWSGAVFFTLSIGAGITLLTFGVILLTQSVPSVARRWVTWLFVVIWGGVLVWVNIGGICPGLSAMLLLIPPVVMLTAVHGAPQRFGGSPLPWRRAIHTGLIGLLLLLWLPRINGDVFVNIKDNLLLTSRPGIKAVDLYYRYTLYPAEVFKSLAQKQIRAHAVTGADAASIQSRINQALAGVNSFPVSDWRYADMVIQTMDDKLLALKDGGAMVQKVSQSQLLTDPWQMVRQFSTHTDNKANFRKATIVSLLGVAPLVLYLATFALFCVVPGLFFPIRVSSVLVPVLCCSFWSAAIVYLDTPMTADLNRETVAKAMASGPRKEKIAALRYIHHNGLEIADFAGYRMILKTDDFAQRYWMVKCLGKSRHPLAMQWIIRAMKSDSPYIVCKAIEAGAGQATAENGSSFTRAVTRKLASSGNWYVQYYAFKVARERGWIPRASE
ncbi:MAG: hypothetical protein SWH61_16810 [Thermodesulfobacteriota bacterium]|nr:hypothetical protein [Thermodesulfobacteriota bacterium]